MWRGRPRPRRLTCISSLQCPRLAARDASRRALRSNFAKRHLRPTRRRSHPRCAGNGRARYHSEQKHRMDGAPIFSLFDTLPVLHLRGFRGILNSTTNVILTGMEQGLSFEQSLKHAQEIGIAETDPTHDVEGWDATVKVAALVIVLMGVPIKLSAIERKWISGLSAEEVRTARAEGNPYKLVCRAQREVAVVTATVRPEKVTLTDPLAWISGTSSIVHFETDILPGLAITEMNPGVETTAYGMLADFIRAASGDA